jgi:hypothetical protein
MSSFCLRAPFSSMKKNVGWTSKPSYAGAGAIPAAGNVVAVALPARAETGAAGTAARAATIRMLNARNLGWGMASLLSRDRSSPI